MSSQAYLALADGAVFPGISVGAACDLPGEAVFNTGMTGYQEIVSDPSYFGQIVALSTAEVGNYGCNDEDMESRGIFLSGLVIQNLNPPSSWRSQRSLDELLKSAGKPILAGVDTRRLVLHLREAGTQRAWLHADGTNLSIEEAVAKARDWPGLDGLDCAGRVTAKQSFTWSESGDKTVVVLDCGVKYNILRQLVESGFRVAVVPCSTSAGEILSMKPAGVLLSNGPGDPTGVTGVIACVRELLGKVPIMGICLGHQILGLACGAKTGRLRFGHHGCNHPVKNLLTGNVEITSQNHNFAILPESLPPELEVTHFNMNDGSIEGLRHRVLPAFSVQYHPEAAPGPFDARYLFKQFRDMIENF
ncbi:MAG: glutamine-hydrolyzing carbamoyl-phosphate synthase small subunit [Victivallales bacterium]|nr:glutamine-hydrolyzing carbamoyl-phosphate synthase small subunit [Victivallales bacterium]MBQ6473085.1 glutamine-hydrolyzing carbamoyl-phosphate synthase small subunit [Victivallales bacterium]